MIYDSKLWECWIYIIYRAEKDQLLLTLVFLWLSNTCLNSNLRNQPDKTHQTKSCLRQKWKHTENTHFSFQWAEKGLRFVRTSSHSSMNSFKSSVLAEPLWFAEVNAIACPYCLATACLKKVKNPLCESTWVQRYPDEVRVRNSDTRWTWSTQIGNMTQVE